MKLSKKLVAVISAGVLASALFAVTGCSSAEDAAPVEKTTQELNAQDLEVTEVGYTVLPDQTVSYAFTVENPNEGWVANSVTFTIEGYSEDGVMLIGGGETLQEVYPGITTAAAGTSYLSDTTTPIARFEVKPLMEYVNWTSTKETPEELNSTFQLSETEVTEENGTMTITGDISADLGPADSSDATASLDNRKDAHVVAILRDADGNILCGGTAMSIMLDPSMTPIITGATEGAVPGTLDEDGNPVESENAEPSEGEEAPAEGEEQAEEENNVATTTYTITIPGIVQYATISVYATPGI